MEESAVIVEVIENEEEKINYTQSFTKQQHAFTCKNCGRHVTINTDKQCSNSIKEKLHTCA